MNDEIVPTHYIIMVSAIMEQLGRVDELKRKLKTYKKELDAIGTPQRDPYCFTHTEEHDEDIEYLEAVEKKDNLERLFHRTLEEKIREEKLYKRMKHEYRRLYPTDSKGEELEIKIAAVKSARHERERRHLKFVSKSSQIIGEMVLNIISIDYKSDLKRLVSSDVIKQVNWLSQKMWVASRTYHGDSRQVLKLAKYMVSKIKDDQHIVDIIYTAMNIEKQISRSTFTSERSERKVINFAKNLERLNEQYTELVNEQNNTNVFADIRT